MGARAASSAGEAAGPAGGGGVGPAEPAEATQTADQRIGEGGRLPGRRRIGEEDGRAAVPCVVRANGGDGAGPLG
jgi:hypothetical protein